jgi:hypothetical protein
LKFRLSQTLCFIAFVCCALFAATTIWLATGRGVGLFGDSVDYIAAARGIASGAGARTLDGAGGYTPLTQFPPAYPALIAAASKATGEDAVVAARVLHIAIHLALIALIAWATYVACGSSRAASAACALGAVSQPLLMIDSRIYSEGPFLCFVLVAFALLAGMASGKRKGRALLAGTALGAAVLTRFAGIFFIPIAVVMILVASAIRWRDRLIGVIELLLLALLPAMAWSWRNGHVTGHPSARRFLFHPLPMSEWGMAAHTMVEWLLPEHLPLVSVWFWIGAVTVICLAIAAIRSVRRDRTVIAHPGPRLAMLTGLLLVLLLYPPFLIVASTFVDANVNFNPRLMSPLFPAVIILAVVSVSTLFSKQRLTKPALVLALAPLIVLVGYNLVRTTDWARYAWARGQGYASKSWIESETLKAVAAAPARFEIFTDGYDVIYLRTGRLVKQLPKARIRSLATTNPSLDSAVDSMVQQMRDRGGWIVLFDRIDRDDYLITESELKDRIPLAPARKRQPKDGKILELAE